MQSLKWTLFLALLIFPSILMSQTRPYLDVRIGGPNSKERLAVPDIETGFLFTPQIGIGLRYEMEPFSGFFYHGFGTNLRISTQTEAGKGWHFSGSIGRGYRVISKSYRRHTNNERPGYLFSEFSVGRHLNRRMIFSSGIRSVTNYHDVPSREHPQASKILISKLTFSIGRPSSSSSPALKKFNRKTYFFGLYSINTRFFDRLRFNGMINTGMGWKLTPHLGVGPSLVLNQGLVWRNFWTGRNYDKLAGLGAHVFYRRDWIWGMIEMGAATQVAKGRGRNSTISYFSYRQHPKATTPYGRFSTGIIFSKQWMAQFSFLIAPWVYGDFAFDPSRSPSVLGGTTRTQEDIYFSYADLSIGIGLFID